MRSAAKRDTTEPEVVGYLQAAGCTVYRMDQPCDLLVHIPGGAFGTNALIEVKSPGGRLTPKQKSFHGAWPGRVHVVESGDEALEVVSLYRNRIVRAR